MICSRWSTKRCARKRQVWTARSVSEQESVQGKQRLFGHSQSAKNANGTLKYRKIKISCLVRTVKARGKVGQFSEAGYLPVCRSSIFHEKLAPERGHEREVPDPRLNIRKTSGYSGLSYILSLVMGRMRFGAPFGRSVARCLLLASASSVSAQAPKAVASLDKVESAQVDEAVRSIMQRDDVPAISLAIVRHGQIAYSKAYGFAELHADIGNIEAAPLPRVASVSSRFAIGSVSKEFTAAAILVLADRGKLALDDTVSKYLPALTTAKQITIRELLSHTSGYRDYFLQEYIPAQMQRPTSIDAILKNRAERRLSHSKASLFNRFANSRLRGMHSSVRSRRDLSLTVCAQSGTTEQTAWFNLPRRAALRPEFQSVFQFGQFSSFVGNIGRGNRSRKRCIGVPDRATLRQWVRCVGSSARRMCLKRLGRANIHRARLALRLFNYHNGLYGHSHNSSLLVTCLQSAIFV